jgi:hypothetical protein
MADNSGMIKLGIAAAVGYYAYTQGWLASLGIGTPAAAAVTPVAAAVTAAAVAPAKPKLADIQAAVILAANAPAAGLSVDQWGWYLNNALAPYGMTAPDPVPILNAYLTAAMAPWSTAGGIPVTAQTFDRSDLIPTAKYWAAMGPALKSQLGLAGLDMYAGRW